MQDTDDEEEYEPPHPELEVQPYRRTILHQDRTIYYKRCPTFQESWEIISGKVESPWPIDVKKNYTEVKCISKNVYVYRMN